MKEVCKILYLFIPQFGFMSGEGRFPEELGVCLQE